MSTERINRGTIEHIPTEYGKSILGASLNIYIPTDEKNIDTLIMSGIHGDEPESTVLLSDALRHILPDELNNAVILCANPDGMANGTRANANGVDLNRNFPASNWQSNDVFYRNEVHEKRDIRLSPGVAASSEPETKYLIKVIETLKPKNIISIHGSLACVEDPTMSTLSKWIATQVKLPLIEDVGYKTPGSLGSWAAEKGITIITLELPSDSLINIKNIFAPMLIKLLSKFEI